MSRTMIAEERMEKFDFYPEPRSTGILRFCVLVLVMAASTLSVIAQSGSGVAQLNLDVTRIVSPISPTLYGLMTEEINHSYDGGLYAEMIQNRAFHSDWEGTPPWDLVRRGNAVASRSLDTSNGPSKVLSYSMRLNVTSASDGNEAGLTNPGFWGFGLVLTLSTQARFMPRVEDTDIYRHCAVSRGIAESCLARIPAASEPDAEALRKPATRTCDESLSKQHGAIVVLHVSGTACAGDRRLFQKRPRRWRGKHNTGCISAI